MTRVRVPAKTGEIIIKPGTPGQDETLKFEEKGGYVEVPDEHLDLFLTHVTGASVSPAPRAEKEK